LEGGDGQRANSLRSGAPLGWPREQARRHLSQRRAVIRKPSILTDPHPAMPRAEANVPYLGDVSRMLQCNMPPGGAAKCPFLVQKTLK